MPFKMFDGTTPKNGQVSPIQATPDQVLHHARVFGEMVPQTLREDSIPDHPVADPVPNDGDPNMTSLMKADRSVLPVFKEVTPLPPLSNPKFPAKFK